MALSPTIEQELKARGVAQVLVYLKPQAPKLTLAANASNKARLSAEATQVSSLSSAAMRLRSHFTTSEASLRSQVRETAEKLAKRGAERPSGMRLAKSKKLTGANAKLASDLATPTFGAADQPVMMYPNLGIMLGTVTKQGAAALEADPEVRAVTGSPPISLIRPERKAAATLGKTLPWGLSAMDVPKLWKKGLTGKGVLLGHLDTGVDGKHKALAGAIASFADFDALGRQITPPPAAYDSDDHGTHTAGTIAGRPVAGKHIGVAHGAELASAIVIEGGDVVARVLGGMDWAVGQGVKVLSMSLGFRGYWEDFEQLTELLRDRDILPVFAIGNEGPGTSRSPGNYGNVLNIGAYGKDNTVAWFSSSQAFQRAVNPHVPLMVAPGVEIVSAMPGGGYQSMDGSSMATPHVAGLAALLFEAVPKATILQVEQAILGSCKLPASMSQFRAGKGMPNAAKALQLLEAM